MFQDFLVVIEFNYRKDTLKTVVFTHCLEVCHGSVLGHGLALS